MDLTAEAQYEHSESPRSIDWVGGSFLLCVMIAIVILIYSTMSWMTDEKRLPLSRLMIEGELQYVSPSMIQEAFATIPTIGTFMTQDVNELQTALKQVPWVAQVSIRKQWPDLVKVYIVEHQAAAIWNGNALLNTSGDIFNGQPDDVPDGLVNLYGPDSSSQKVLDVWRSSSQQLKTLGRSITSVVLNDRLSWQLILDNGIRLELGKDIQENRLSRFIQLYKRLGEKAEQVSYIDLRYDTGAAIGWLANDLEQESTQ